MRISSYALGSRVLNVAVILVASSISSWGLDNGCSAPGYGRFVGEVKTTWVDGRDMILEESFSYIDPHGTTWDAPKEFKIDGASIPRPFWSLIGGPFEGCYRYASVVHDVACVRGESHSPGARPWKEVHRMFYEALRAGGVENSKALAMYAAVYKYGPRWDLTANAEKVPWWTKVFGIRRESAESPSSVSPVPPPTPQKLTDKEYRGLETLIQSRGAKTPDDVDKLLK